MINLQDNQRFYYKVVARLGDKLFSIYDSKTEFHVGTTLYQKAKTDHKGGYYVYETFEEALFANIPDTKEKGLFLAPRVILKVICWGEKIEYPTGKFSFSYICPAEVIEMPRGYKTTGAGKREALRAYLERAREKEIKKIKPRPRGSDLSSVDG